MEDSARVRRLMHYVVGSLMMLTIVLLVWHHFGMERVLTLSADSGHVIDVRDDRAEGGGTVSSLTRSAGRLRLECKVVDKLEWHFCGLDFRLGQEPHGVDLSEFDTISLDMRYSGPAVHALKLSILNFEPGRSKHGVWPSHHVNELEFTMPANKAVLDIPLKLLYSPAWWVQYAQVPLENTGQRINNATLLEISMGKVLGQQSIEVRSIKIRGKWIHRETLLSILVGLWFACGVMWPVLGALQLRQQLANREARLAAANKLNQVLQLETRELATQAHQDPLTGTLNRLGLRDALLKQSQGPTESADTAAVVFVDIDHFKRINDMHGHAIGDEVLRRFSALLHANIRAADILVRWGGEEFLIVCPATKALQAGQLAEKLRAAATERDWPEDLQVTASFGVSALVDGEDIGEAIQRADEALYRAKASGRNRVEVA